MCQVDGDDGIDSIEVSSSVDYRTLDGTVLILADSYSGRFLFWPMYRMSYQGTAKLTFPVSSFIQFDWDIIAALFQDAKERNLN